MSLPDNNSFCILPWIHRVIDTTGGLRDCCYTPLIEGHISEWEETWNNERMKDLRRDMVFGKRIPDCAICYRNEDAGKESDRLVYNGMYADDSKTHDIVGRSLSNGFHVTDDPSVWEFRFGNLCNLRCKMCSSQYSSMVQKDSADLKEIDEKGYWEYLAHNSVYEGYDFDWFTEASAMDALIRIIPSLEIIQVAGGEPTLSSEFREFLAKCIELDHAKNIIIHISTNLTNINDELINMMHQFKEVYFTFSIDGIESPYEYIRVPANWKKVQENMIRIMKESANSNFNVCINMVVQLCNVMYISDALDEFIQAYQEYCADDQIFRIRLTVTTFPDYFRIDRAPDAVRQIARHRLQRWIDTNQYGTELLSRIFETGTIDMVMNYLDTPKDTPYTGVYLFNYFTFIELKSKVKLKDKIPELYEIIVHMAEEEKQDPTK